MILKNTIFIDYLQVMTWVLGNHTENNQAFVLFLFCKLLQGNQIDYKGFFYKHISTNKMKRILLCHSFLIPNDLVDLDNDPEKTANTPKRATPRHCESLIQCPCSSCQKKTPKPKLDPSLIKPLSVSTSLYKVQGTEGRVPCSTGLEKPSLGCSCGVRRPAGQERLRRKADVASGLFLATDSEQNILVIDKEKAAKCEH